tara:strand:+ start:860 stop:1057 length:198 start_codon:yes stop_codon:yes gene_type:complete
MKKQFRKELKKLTFKWGFLDTKDPLQDKYNLIRALDVIHEANQSLKTDMLKQNYYYNYVNTGGKQ